MAKGVKERRSQAEAAFLHLRVGELGAAVEERERGGRRPVVLCHRSEPKISSISPAASRRGVRPGMSCWEAQRLCPELAVVDANPEKYRHFQQQIRETCADYGPVIRWHPREDGGEGTLDLAGAHRLFGEAREVALEIRNRLRAEVGVLVQLGVGPTPLVAQLAACIARPGEVSEVARAHADGFLARVPLSTVPGLGTGWARELAEMGLQTVGDVAKLPPESVARVLGERGLHLWRAAHGEEPSLLPVLQEEAGPRGEFALDAASLEVVSGEAELSPATRDRTEIHAALRAAAEEAARGLRACGKMARLVHVDLVSRDMRRVELRRTLVQPARDADTLYATACLLADRVRLGDRLLRRVRIRSSRLTLADQSGQLVLPLSDREARRARLAENVDRVRDRFGDSSVRRASVARLTRT